MAQIRQTDGKLPCPFCNGNTENAGTSVYKLCAKKLVFDGPVKDHGLLDDACFYIHFSSNREYPGGAGNGKYAKGRDTTGIRLLLPTYACMACKHRFPITQQIENKSTELDKENSKKFEDLL